MANSLLVRHLLKDAAHQAGSFRRNVSSNRLFKVNAYKCHQCK